MLFLVADASDARPWWFDPVANLGLPSLLLFVVSFAVWQTVRPLVTRLFEAQIAANEANAHAAKSHAEANRSNAEAIRQIAISQRNAEEQLRRLADLAGPRA